jgi:hypothetical protein
MLLGPILQALWQEPSSTQRFQYCQTITSAIIAELETDEGNLSSYNNIFYGADYLKNVKKGSISDDNIVLMLSMDGAQLYAHKASDCWIYIWSSWIFHQMKATRRGSPTWWVYSQSKQTKNH